MHEWEIDVLCRCAHRFLKVMNESRTTEAERGMSDAHLYLLLRNVVMSQSYK